MNRNVNIVDVSADALTGFIVCCTDLHISIGPFETKRKAEILALTLSMLALKASAGNDMCKYQAVPLFKPPVEAVSIAEKAQSQEAAVQWKWNPHKGYL